MINHRASDRPGIPGRRALDLDELARRKGIRPVDSAAEMTQDGIFTSDDEMAEFLEHVYARRHTDLI